MQAESKHGIGVDGRVFKILVVEPDPEILEILVSSLTRRFDAHITCVSDSISCMDVEMIEPHDLVVTELELEGETGEGERHGESGLKLAGQLMSLSARPVILLSDDLSSDEAVEALRLRVFDVLQKPFVVDQLLEAADRALHGFDLKRRRAARYRRMRDLVRRVIQERRSVHRRMELVCRDLVGAHKRLVHRVSSIRE